MVAHVTACWLANKLYANVDCGGVSFQGLPKSFPERIMEPLLKKVDQVLGPNNKPNRSAL